MKVPTIVCALCGKEVSKRSSLSLAVFGAGDGRACRSHEEVVRMVAVMSEEKKSEQTLRAFERRFKVISATAALRTVCTLYGLKPEFVYMRLYNYFPRDQGLMREIEEEVARCGGPIISDKELDESVMSAVWASQKLAELGLS